MTAILKDFSAAALVEAIKGNRFEWYRYLGRWPAAELHVSSNLTRLFTGTPFPLMNGVQRARLAPGTVDQVIEETVAYF